MNENTIREIVDCLKEQADELRSKGTNNLNEVEFGQLLSLAEALCIVQDACAGYNLSAIGLDFDIDARYLLG